MNTANDILVAFLEKLAGSPQTAADELEKLAQELLATAEQLRQATAGQELKSPGGVSDRVRLTVSGPGGQQTVEVT